MFVWSKHCTRLDYKIWKLCLLMRNINHLAEFDSMDYVLRMKQNSETVIRCFVTKWQVYWVVKISLFNKKLQFSPCIAISQILHNPWNPKQLQLVVKYNCFGLLANCNVHFSLLDNSFDVQHQISMSIFMLVVKNWR